MATDLLTDKAIRAALKRAAGAGSDEKISDGDGLLLIARPSGAGWWRLRYRFGGKERMLSLGVYPEVPLAVARERRDEARKLVAAGVDPSEDRKARKAERAVEAEAQALAAAGLPVPGTFAHAAREWHQRQSVEWVAGHAKRILSLIERDLIPHLGARRLADLTAPEVLSVVRRIEARGSVETAQRGLKVAGAVFRYGVQHGWCTSDPTRDLAGAFVVPPAKHRPALTDPAQVAELLRAIEGYKGTPIVRAALQLAPLLFLRPGELRKLEWAWVDLDGATLTIPAAAMKGRLATKLNGPPHVVPLAPQSVKVLRELHPLTGAGRYVFPNPRAAARPLSENGVLAALRRMGYERDEMTGHGFRAMARTILHERLSMDPAVIEAQLAHRVPDALGRAYNRTLFLEQRRQMMSAWASYLERLREGA